MYQNMTGAMRRILKAREKVARRNEWFGAIIYSSRLVETQDTPYGMETMFTDGINVYFHPNFVRDEDPFIEGVFLHENLHCALNHVGRRQWRDAALWNEACDYAINPLVLSIFALPKCALVDRRFDGMRAERIYDILEKERKGKGPKGDKPVKTPPGNGPVQPGTPQGDDDEDGQEGNKPTTGKSDKPEDKPASGPMREPSPEEMEKAKEEWRRVVKRATDKAEKAGNMPGAVRAVIEELFPSEKLDWRKLTDDMARDAREEVNTSWTRPNRRWIGSDIVLPGQSLNKVFRLVVCVDCSGSISDAVSKEMKAEAINLLEQKIATHITLIATDTEVCNEADVITAEDVSKFEIKRGGGTCFIEAMKRVAEIEDAMGCIFLTDMETMSFGEDPGIPVIWVDWTKRGTVKAPFGKSTIL